MLARIGLVLAFVLPASAQTVQLVSQSTTGVQGNGDSRAPRISADGEWVVFKSDASTLVLGDSNGVGDIFLRHLNSGTTTLISVGLGGAPANGESFSPAISADGSVIAFQSSASNLVAGDTNGKADIFVWEAGVITRVSVGTGGAQSNGASDKPSVSGDGRYVAYESVGSNLIVGDTNGASDIFRFDRVTGSVVRASVSSTGAEANGASHAPWLNGNGAVVAFDSAATNLVGGDTNASSDVFVRDLVGGTTLGATLLPGLVGNGSSDTASISADGQFIAFRSDATNLVASDSNGVADVFLADPWNQQLLRVSEGTGGVQGNGAASLPQLAPDGLFVAFTSAASNLVTGDTNARDDVFVHDVAAAKTKRISSDAYGVPGNGHSRAPSVASGGASTAFKSDASNLLAGDANGIGDVFVRRPAAMTWYVDASAVPPGTGSSTTPFVDLQVAIDAPHTLDGDTILVAPGTYHGGFDLGPKQLALRGVAGAAETILDGQGTQTVIRALAPSGDELLTKIEGFTIRSGFATSPINHPWLDILGPGGGGVACEYRAVRLSYCVIESCTGAQGSAVAASFSDVQMDHCMVRDNRLETPNSTSSAVLIAGPGSPVYPTQLEFTSIEENDGHGIFFYDLGDAQIASCDLARNQDRGMLLAIAACTMSDSRVEGNLSGGLAVFTDSDIDINDSEITMNQGPALECEDDSAVYMTDGIIMYNGSAVVFEDAGYGGPADSCTLRRVVVEGSFDLGVGFHGLSLDQCTALGGVISGSPGSVFIRNSIVWGYSVQLPLTIMTAEYSDIEFSGGGVGCIQSWPELWDMDGGDAHLLPASPCIDAGDPASPLDPDGSIADMGAIPFDPNYCGTPRVYCTAKLNSLGCMPSIAWTGTPSLTGSSDDFHITASNVLNNKNGLLFWGTQDFGAPFQGGTLCVKPPIVRTDVQNSGGNPPPNDCSGSYDFHMSQSFMAASLLQVGTTIYAQYWSRDPGFSPPNNVGLTDALRVVVCP